MYRGAIAALLLVCGLFAAPSARAQALDPAAAVQAYVAALNAHDISAGLALFDEYGSATDATSHHFEGTAGLTSFLEANGFANPEAIVQTQ